jgi:hypothetical protein
MFRLHHGSFIIIMSSLPLSLSSGQGLSSSKLLLPDEPRKHSAPKYQTKTYAQSRPRSLAVALPYNVLQIRLEALEVGQTGPDSFSNLRCVFVTTKSVLQCLSQRLVERCCTHRDTKDGSKRSEEVATGGCYSLIGVRSICDYMLFSCCHMRRNNFTYSDQ